MRVGIFCRALLILPVIWVTFGVGQSRSDKAAQAIRDADQQWAAAASAKDLEKSVAFCAPDGAILVPNAPAASGKDMIRKWFQDAFNTPGFKLMWHATKVGAARSGDLGYSSGEYELSFTNSGKQVTDHGKYVTVWKKQTDGSWKALLDIFNSDLSAAGGG